MSEAITDPEIKDLLECGIIAVDKTQGPSSHQVTAWVKEILGGDVRIGHGGTLDPMVSGVLIIMLGRAVRLAPVILKHRKEYIAVLRLHGDVSEDDVMRAAEEFRGKIYQRPPRRSAVRRQLRIRTIYNIDILDFSQRLVLMRVSCEAGTYIRSLCTHMALSMGVGGQMEELRRSRSGSLGIPDTCTLQDLKDAFVFSQEGKSEALKKMILPVERLISEVPVIRIRDSAVEALCCGASLAGVGVLARENYRRDALVAITTEKNELVCIGKALVSSEEYKPGDTGLVAAPLAVVMKRGTYEKGWTTHEHKKETSDNEADTILFTNETGKSEDMKNYQTGNKPFKSESGRKKVDYTEKTDDYKRKNTPAGEKKPYKKPYSNTKKTEHSVYPDSESRAKKPYSKDKNERYQDSAKPVKIVKLSENPYYLKKTEKCSDSEEPYKNKKTSERAYPTDKKYESKWPKRSFGDKDQSERPFSGDKNYRDKNRDFKKPQYNNTPGPARTEGRAETRSYEDNDSGYRKQKSPSNTIKPPQKSEYKAKKHDYTKSADEERTGGRVIKMKRLPDDKFSKKQEFTRESDSAKKSRSSFQPYKKARK